MSTTIEGDPELYPVGAPIPADGEKVTAASVGVPLEALFHRTAHVMEGDTGFSGHKEFVDEVDFVDRATFGKASAYNYFEVYLSSTVAGTVKNSARVMPPYVIVRNTLTTNIVISLSTDPNLVAGQVITIVRASIEFAAPSNHTVKIHRQPGFPTAICTMAAGHGAAVSLMWTDSGTTPGAFRWLPVMWTAHVTLDFSS